jgi:hypothetical protein
MVTTFTGNAIESVLPNFQKATNGTKASKVLVVITDGVHSQGSADPKQAAQKWKDLGATVYAIGVGNGISKTGLEAIGEAYLAKDFIDAAKRIVSEIVPTICGTSDALFGSGLIPQM